MLFMAVKIDMDAHQTRLTAILFAIMRNRILVHRI